MNGPRPLTPRRHEIADRVPVAMNYEIESATNFENENECDHHHHRHLLQSLLAMTTNSENERKRNSLLLPLSSSPFRVDPHSRPQSQTQSESIPSGFGFGRDHHQCPLPRSHHSIYDLIPFHLQRHRHRRLHRLHPHFQPPSPSPHR